MLKVLYLLCNTYVIAQLGVRNILTTKRNMNALANQQVTGTAPLVRNSHHLKKRDTGRNVPSTSCLQEDHPFAETIPPVLRQKRPL
jgi:hypothetical protein